MRFILSKVRCKKACKSRSKATVTGIENVYTRPLRSGSTLEMEAHTCHDILDIMRMEYDDEEHLETQQQQ